MTDSKGASLVSAGDLKINDTIVHKKTFYAVSGINELPETQERELLLVTGTSLAGMLLNIATDLIVVDAEQHFWRMPATEKPAADGSA